MDMFFSTPPVRLADNPACRHEYRVDETLIGFVEYYHVETDTVALAVVTHTEVVGQAEGRGHGSRLAASALAHFQQQGCQVVPVCGFFANFLRKHPAHARQASPMARALFSI